MDKKILIKKALVKFLDRCKADIDFCDNECKNIDNNMSELEFIHNRRQFKIYEKNSTFNKYCYLK